MSMREQTTVRSPDGTTLCSFQARRRLAMRAHYDIHGSEGEIIGGLERRGMESLLRTTWVLTQPSGVEIVTARERNMVLAAFNRLKELVGLIPVVGEILELIPIPLPVQFDLERGGLRVGAINRPWGLRDQYEAYLNPDNTEAIGDARLLIALGIGMDALTGR